MIIIGKMLAGLTYLHSKGIAHRDIKPENILFDSKANTLKIVDFEIARSNKNTEEKLEMWTDAGSIYYRAPETFEGLYSYEVDIWATGVVLYELLYGERPFKGNLEKEVKSQILSKELNFSLYPLSLKTRVLLRRLLDRNPLSRISASEG